MGIEISYFSLLFTIGLLLHVIAASSLTSDPEPSIPGVFGLPLPAPAPAPAPANSQNSKKISFKEIFSDHVTLAGSNNDSADTTLVYPEAVTPLGGFRGVAIGSRGGLIYFAYGGIFYSNSPKRFEAAQLAQPFSGVQDAQRFGPACPQNANTYGLVENENCLSLNVYHPHTDRCMGLLPVIVYFHYGSWMAGSAQMFYPTYFMDECVVLVTVNYRIGLLGFLTTNDEVIPGNLGLKDQVVSLKWVQKCISSFRGDPDLVTIMGISSGAASVSHLVASPMAKGLFSRAIQQSGSALNPWAVSRNMSSLVSSTAASLNCPTNSSTAFRQCLELKSVKEIIAAQQNAPYSTIAPVIEPENASNPFQTKPPADVFQSGDFNRCPLLTGTVKDEGIEVNGGAMLTHQELLSQLNQNWTEVAPLYFLYENQFSSLSPDQATLQTNQMSEKIRQFYFGNRNQEPSPAIGLETREALINICSDRYINMGVMKTAEYHSKFAPVYKYMMSYEEIQSNAIMHGYYVPAITHGDDAKLFFESPMLPLFNGITYGSDRMEFSKNLIALWVSFAKTGAPIGNVGYVNAENSWKSYSSGDYGTWFELNSKASVLTNYLEDRWKFWECDVAQNCQGIHNVTVTTNVPETSVDSLDTTSKKGGANTFTAPNLILLFSPVLFMMVFGSIR